MLHRASGVAHSEARQLVDKSVVLHSPLDRSKVVSRPDSQYGVCGVAR